MSLGRSAALTDTGRRRRHNEDSYICEPPLFAIADGMGGAQAGEVASRLAAAVLNEPEPEHEGGGAPSGEAHVVELIQEANRRVFQRSTEDEAVSGMGTTMTVALVDPTGDRVVIGHVGDSRAYRVRGGELEQLTEDHSLVNELLKSGKLSPEEAQVHPQRSVITRAIGTEPDVDVDAFTVEVQAGDLFLLCSDGLTDMLSDDEILGVVESGSGDLDAALRGLVEAANTSGGEDNITVVAFEIVATPVGADDATTAESVLDDTARLPAATTVQAPPVTSDEDTLSSLDQVPAVDTAVVSTAEIEEQLAAEKAEAAADTDESPAAEAPAEEEPVEETRAARTVRPTTVTARPVRSERRVLPLLLLLVLLCAIAVLVVWGLYR